jgi:peptidoglycan/xylan/chitin deacetylase (PgdA/CDA1 family)
VLRLVIPVAVLAVWSGCGLQPACPDSADGPRHVVLTFDDGPIPADIADPELRPDLDLLLAPLNEVLARLEAHGARAVFYIKGPGTSDAAEELKPAYAAGIGLMREAGHVLGYHCYRHAQDVWIEPFEPGPVVQGRMTADLDQLVVFLDDVLAPSGLEQADVFSPLFRPPFGGAGMSAPDAEAVARARGWTFHGFRIDSMDWTTNADADVQLTARLPVASEADHVAYVRRCLRRGVSRQAGCQDVDVLMHINAFTAAHLDEWFDELTAACVEETGYPPVFDVPDAYLREDDPVMDMSFLLDLIGPL